MFKGIGGKGEKREEVTFEGVDEDDEACCASVRKWESAFCWYGCSEAGKSVAQVLYVFALFCCDLLEIVVEWVGKAGIDEVCLTENSGDLGGTRRLPCVRE